MTEVRSVLVWVTEGTWRASVDAALRFAPAGASITLLHVSPAATQGRASRSLPPPQPPACSMPRPAGSAARASNRTAAASRNVRS